MVGVAEWLRRQVVALEIEGSNPSVHPNPTMLEQHVKGFFSVFLIFGLLGLFFIGVALSMHAW